MAKGPKHRVVSRDKWVAARKALLRKEKAFSKARDKLARERRKLPWVKVDKAYVFDGPDGRASLADLFDGRSQLAVYHFMFPPEWENGCKHCSFWADHYDAATGAHLRAKDTSFAVISRAPLAKIEPFKRRMGWQFKWLSSGANDFNYDFGASFTPKQVKAGAKVFNYGQAPGMSDREGLSVFFRDKAGNVFHTYSTWARGIDLLNGTYNVLDLTPLGRNEDPDATQGWVQYHDSYK